MGYSWEEAKGPRHKDLLDFVPSASTFRALEERIDVLAARVHTESGVLKTDVPPEDLAQLAETYEHLGRFEDVTYLLSTATDIDSLSGQQFVWAIWRARLRCRQGDPAGASELLSETLREAEHAEKPEAVSELQTALALVDLTQDHVDSAFDRLNRAFATARDIKSTPAKAHALSAVGIGYTLRAQYMEAVDVLQRASLLHQRIGDRNSLAKVYNNIGVTLLVREVDHVSIPYLEFGLEFAAPEPDLRTCINSLSNNIRGFEINYLEGAHEIREALSGLLAYLPDRTQGRLTDLTMLPASQRETPEDATYETAPFIAEPLLFLSMQPTRSLTVHRDRLNAS